MEIDKTAEQSDGASVRFGPDGEMWLPATFQREVRYAEQGLAVTFEFEFGGDKVLVPEVRIRSLTGSIASRDLTRLELQEAVRYVIEYELAARGGGVSRPTETGPTGDNLRTVATIYWKSHAGWGSPRADVMRHFDISRTTANAWIRKAAELHPMPGPHAKEERTDGKA